ncbi:DUF2141 domain-containing protein [Nitrospirillum sp. BR 11164]|uniref:DUF2141 domain-containing protein n=1 Tax=Nitrospirillum sp. BR 11164 TaxID=3104324 RepID=UPI002B0001FF|nr:DUF2141 domain-containing protein [Nitrospirillum sp. BR 11164]MEA1648084.1 DUF2141 domain-containing protein [Nitrospirillum sp. BR 11164]
MRVKLDTRAMLAGIWSLAAVAAPVTAVLVLPVEARAEKAVAMPGPLCDPDNAAQVRLRLSVTGMHSGKGNVTITIYPDDADHFLDGAYKVARQILPVVLPVTEACFVLPQAGRYAVALFHDENDNGHFDTTMLGIPAEGYGFSNNPTLYLGPPNLDKVRIPVQAGDNPVSVLMKYY